MRDRSNVACFSGEKALQVPTLSTEPALIMSNGIAIPQLAYGMYKIPATDEGETIVGHAIKAGYRHFDSASAYENESTLGRALKKSGIPRESFFICSKVWKDPQIHGRQAVRKSVEESLAALDNRDDGYLDLFLIHWPVPGYHVEAYKELELLHQEGKIRSLGISNYLPQVKLYYIYRYKLPRWAVAVMCSSEISFPLQISTHALTSFLLCYVRNTRNFSQQISK
jgi:aryl-alcohol dehydrogenase-like predicted oxidoreductase